MDEALFMSARITDQSVLNRLEMLENNLTRVTNQHDALLPLLDLVELLPHVQKNLEQCRQVKQRLTALDERLAGFNNQLKEKITHGAFSSVDGNFKSSHAQLQELRLRVRQLQDSVVSEGKQSLQRLKDDAASAIRSLDQRIDVSKGEVHQFLKEFKLGIGELERSMREHPTAELFPQQRLHFKAELENVKREIGLLQCEMEYLMDVDRTSHIRGSMANLGSLSAAERNFSIGHLEQELFVDEYEQFEESNTGRLKYELQLLENSLAGLAGFVRDGKPTSSVRESARTELEFVGDRHYSIANQAKGAELKKRLEARRLRNRMHKIAYLVRDMTAPEQASMSAKIREVELLRKRMQSIDRVADGNATLLRRQLSELRERLAQCQGTLG